MAKTLASSETKSRSRVGCAYTLLKESAPGLGVLTTTLLVTVSRADKVIGPRPSLPIQTRKRPSAVVAAATVLLASRITD
jgi:hypothetical protein